MHGHSGGVLPGPIPNPEVKPSCVVSCTVARKPTGKFVAVPLSFTPAQIPDYWRSHSETAGEEMAISTGDILGHAQVGVYLSVVDKVLFHPRSLHDAAIEELQSAFDLEMYPFLVGGSSLLGSLLTGNDKGIAVADIATEDDLDELTSFSDVVVMESGVNAAGNLMVCNAHGAVVSPVVPQGGVEMISEVLGVDAIRSKVAGHDTVGSMLVANGNGVLAHPDVSRSEAESIESVMKVQVMVGTVTFGSPYVGAGCAASDTHALVGSGSTGPELNRIEDALGLI